MSEIIKEGTVVYIIYRICVNRSVPAIAGARFVVSLNGESLSPKYAPLMIAPATIASFIPKAFPIPNKAIPIVAIVDQELPVATLTIEQTIVVVKRNKLGFIISKP